MSTMQSRTPWQVTRSVWHAMFMREAVSRTMADRMGWFWMIVEPMAFIAMMVAVRTYLKSEKIITNAEFIPWMIAGMMGFFLVREGMMRGMGAVDANKALFAYRQVQPIDPVLVRCFLEGTIRTLVFLIFITAGLLLNIDLMPDNAMLALLAWLSLWFLGLGLGLLTSVANTLVPEIGKVIKMLSLPLMLVSGAIIPLNTLPHWALEYLMLNPIPHGLEWLRKSFFEHYHVIPGSSVLYFWLFALSTLSLGLLLHIRFVNKLKAN